MRAADVARAFALDDAEAADEAAVWERYRRALCRDAGWPGERAMSYIEFHWRHTTLGELGCVLAHLDEIDAVVAALDARRAARDSRSESGVGGSAGAGVGGGVGDDDDDDAGGENAPRDDVLLLLGDDARPVAGGARSCARSRPPSRGSARPTRPGT